MPKKQKTWKTDLKKEMKIIKLMKETEKHNHKTCDCEGCYWWYMTLTIFKNGRFFEVIPTWKDLGKDEYLRTMQRLMQYKMDKKATTKQIINYLKKQGASPDQAKIIAKRMQASTFSVMYKKAPSPLGLLRDI